MADFKEALQKARNMIHNDAKRDAHIIKERVADRNNPKYFADQPYDSFSTMSSVNSLSNDSDMSMDTDRLDEAFANMVTPTQLSTQNMSIPQSNSLNNIKNSKMPKAILESLSDNYIDQSKLYDGYSAVLDDFVEQTKTAPITEEVKPVINAPQMQMNGVDYSLIKTIVEDCIRKYAGSITKKILSEQKNQQSLTDQLKAIRIGESFTFITSNGDLYEAELKFKKNINKQKNKGN